MLRAKHKCNFTAGPVSTPRLTTLYGTVIYCTMYCIIQFMAELLTLLWISQLESVGGPLYPPTSHVRSPSPSACAVLPYSVLKPCEAPGLRVFWRG